MADRLIGPCVVASGTSSAGRNGSKSLTTSPTAPYASNTLTYQVQLALDDCVICNFNGLEQYSHLLKKLPSASKHKALSPVKHPPTPPFDTSKLRANWEQAYEHRRASSAPTQQSSSGSQSSKRRSAPASQRPITAFFAKTAKGEHAERYFEITTAFGEKKRIRDDFYDSD